MCLRATKKNFPPINARMNLRKHLFLFLNTHTQKEKKLCFFPDKINYRCSLEMLSQNNSPEFMSVIICMNSLHGKGKVRRVCLCMPHKWLPTVFMLVFFLTDLVIVSQVLMQLCSWDSRVLSKSTVFPKDLLRMNQSLNTSLLYYAL